MRVKKIICAVISVLCLAAIFSCGGKNSGGTYPEPEYDAYVMSQENTVLGLQSTDSLGRYFSACDEFDSDKKVGMFYFIWNGYHGDGNVWDSSKLSEDVLKYDESTLEVYHTWSEPLYGYYNSEDAWVFIKHMELLSMAGVDYIVFDVSNSYVYRDACEKFLPAAAEFVQKGWRIPKFIFYCNRATKNTVTDIYDWFYAPNNPELRKYDCLWYTEGDNGERNLEHKPWIFVKNNGLGTDATDPMSSLQDYDRCRAEIKEFFYIREMKWHEEHAEGNEWIFPSDIDDPIVHKGMISVSAAQHPSGAFSDSVFEPGARDNNRGRGWVWEEGKTSGTNVESNVYLGVNYQNEWDFAKSFDDANNIFITSWNEWIAKKFPIGDKGRSTCHFVDQFNPEFSRDIEMTADLWGDNFYLQTALNIRDFKRAEVQADKKFMPRRTEIDINADDLRWKDTVGYLDPVGDCENRNCRSANTGSKGNIPNTVYTNTTGRNDIVKTNVTCDDKNVYFRIECDADITAYEAGDKTWMNILVEIEGLKGNNWENYQFVINRTIDGKKTAVERLKRNGSSESIVGYGEFSVCGNVMTVAVPREFIGLAEKESFTVNFKVADHVTNYTDIMDYYVNGDSAPIGRLNYTFGV